MDGGPAALAMVALLGMAGFVVGAVLLRLVLQRVRALGTLGFD